MKKITVHNVIDLKSTDEEFIIAIRAEPTQVKQDRIFNQFLFNAHAAQKHSWDVTIRRYIRWRMKQSRSGFGIYDEHDLYQRCAFSFYKAAYKKFELDRGVKFSTYIYTAIEKTINRVSCELRKKKRTVEMHDKEGKEIRVSPRYFTDSIHKPYCDNSKMCLGDILPDDSGDVMPEDQAAIVDAIRMKCKERLTEMQFDIFFNGEVNKTTTVRELAKKYNKSEPTISAIKKRKIIPVLKEIKSEVLKEFKCVRF